MIAVHRAALMSLFFLGSCGGQSATDEIAAVHTGGADSATPHVDGGDRLSTGAGGANAAGAGGQGVAGASAIDDDAGTLPANAADADDSVFFDTSGRTLRFCPSAAAPPLGASCVADLSCTYVDRCICGACCSGQYVCKNGVVVLGGYNDGCYQVSPYCDAGADAPPAPSDAARPDADARACTPFLDQTCNENPALSSVHGICTAEGQCSCRGDAAPLPSGRCL